MEEDSDFVVVDDDDIARLRNSVQQLVGLLERNGSAEFVSSPDVLKYDRLQRAIQDVVEHIQLESSGSSPELTMHEPMNQLVHLSCALNECLTIISTLDDTSSNRSVNTIPVSDELQKFRQVCDLSKTLHERLQLYADKIEPQPDAVPLITDPVAESVPVKESVPVAEPVIVAEPVPVAVIQPNSEKIDQPSSSSSLNPVAELPSDTPNLFDLNKLIEDKVDLLLSAKLQSMMGSQMESSYTMVQSQNSLQPAPVATASYIPSTSVPPCNAGVLVSEVRPLSDAASSNYTRPPAPFQHIPVVRFISNPPADLRPPSYEIHLSSQTPHGNRQIQNQFTQPNLLLCEPMPIIPTDEPSQNNTAFVDETPTPDTLQRPLMPSFSYDEEEPRCPACGATFADRLALELHFGSCLDTEAAVVSSPTQRRTASRYF